MQGSAQWQRADRIIRSAVHRIHDVVGWPFQWFLRSTIIGRWVLWRTTANFWSLLRSGISLLLWPLLTSHHDATALGIFILAVITDRLDGELARMTKTASRLGMMLDTCADSVLMFSVLGGLAGRYPWPILPRLMMGLEILRLLGAVIIGELPGLAHRLRALQPNMSGKYKMVVVAISVASVLGGTLHLAHQTIILAVGLSIYSLVRHLYDLVHPPREEQHQERAAR